MAQFPSLPVHFPNIREQDPGIQKKLIQLGQQITTNLKRSIQFWQRTTTSVLELLILTQLCCNHWKCHVKFISKNCALTHYVAFLEAPVYSHLCRMKGRLYSNDYWCTGGGHTDRLTSWKMAPCLLTLGESQWLHLNNPLS